MWDGFAEFSLVRRVGNLLQLPLAVGIGVSLARYVSIAVTEQRPGDLGRYFLPPPWWWAFCPACSSTWPSWPSGRPIASLLFSDAEYKSDLAALGILILGLNFHTVVYGYLRGMLKMSQANTLQVANKALIPLAVFLRPGLEVDQIFRQVGWGQIILSAVAALLVLMRYTPGSLAVTSWGSQFKELLRYGGMRIPGEFALAGLLGLPAVFISHSTDPQTAGLFAFSLAMLVMVGAMFAPLGLVMLPQLSSLQASGQVEKIPHIVGRALLVAVSLAAAGAITFQFIGDFVIRVYLGQGFENVASVAKVVLWAAIPYVVYIVLRNALDALKVQPYNTKNLVIALVVLVALQPFISGAAAEARAILAAMTVLGLLSLLDYRRLMIEMRK